MLTLVGIGECGCETSQWDEISYTLLVVCKIQPQQSLIHAHVTISNVLRLIKAHQFVLGVLASV